MKTILAHPNFEYLANQIYLDNLTQIHKAKADMWVFPDLWPNIFIHDVKTHIEHKEITYIWDFSKPENLFINFSIIRWILDYEANKVRIILPFFPVWTMERIDKKWEIATAKYFAEILSQFPFWRNGKTSIHIFDIHALVERFLFDSKNVNVEIHTFMSQLKQEIKGRTIVFPDEWAKKRFWSDFEWFDVIVWSKQRVWDKRIITFTQWDPNWKDVIIIDDLIQTWGTIKETADKLRELWAKSVYAFATHGIFPNNSHIKLASSLDKLIVTDTIPENISRANDVKNMEVLSIKPLLEKIIFRN